MDASEFPLLDSEGKVRATLSIMNGGPRLALMGRTGKETAVLCNFGGESRLELCDGAGGGIFARTRSPGLGRDQLQETAEVEIRSAVGRPTFRLGSSLEGSEAAFDYLDAPRSEDGVLAGELDLSKQRRLRSTLISGFSKEPRQTLETAPPVSTP